MARLVEIDTTDEGGSVYETVLDSEDDINALYNLMIALEEGGLIAPVGFSRKRNTKVNKRKKYNTKVNKKEKSENYEERN